LTEAEAKRMKIGLTASAKARKIPVVLEMMTKVRSRGVSLQVLKATGLHETVKTLLKDADSQVSAKARNLISFWKDEFPQTIAPPAAAAAPSIRKVSGYVPEVVHEGRRRTLTTTKNKREGDTVIYWMSRDQRAEDNWALAYARELVGSTGRVIVAFNLVSEFLGATERHFAFMLQGLAEVEETLRQAHIPFLLKRGDAHTTIPDLVDTTKAAAVVTDFSPLRLPTEWAQGVARELDKQGVPLYQVDAHNIVPVWVASDKKEVGARTLRPKIHAVLAHYLTEIPRLVPNAPSTSLPPPINWEKRLRALNLDNSVGKTSFDGGASHAKAKLESFCATRLRVFADARNDPNIVRSLSLSPSLPLPSLPLSTYL